MIFLAQKPSTTRYWRRWESNASRASFPVGPPGIAPEKPIGSGLGDRTMGFLQAGATVRWLPSLRLRAQLSMPHTAQPWPLAQPAKVLPAPERATRPTTTARTFEIRTGTRFTLFGGELNSVATFAPSCRTSPFSGTAAFPPCPTNSCARSSGDVCGGAGGFFYYALAPDLTAPHTASVLRQ